MRIGALATSTGTTTKTLRFYEQAGLPDLPPRTPSGYRDYPAQAATRVAFIRTAQAPCAHVTTLLDHHLAEVERRLAELQATRAMLRDLARTASTTDPATCTEGDICRILAAQ